MEGEQEMASVMTRPMRACRPGAIREPTRTTGAFRAPQDQAEVDRRVAFYAQQIEQTGRITWLPPRGEGQNA